MDLAVRKATEKDIPKILDLLVQVDMVHHNGRSDIFKGPATKYDEEELRAVIHNEEILMSFKNYSFSASLRE